MRLENVRASGQYWLDFWNLGIVRPSPKVSDGRSRGDYAVTLMLLIRNWLEESLNCIHLNGKQWREVKGREHKLLRIIIETTSPHPVLQVWRTWLGHQHNFQGIWNLVTLLGKSWSQRNELEQCWISSIIREEALNIQLFPLSRILIIFTNIPVPMLTLSSKKS